MTVPALAPARNPAETHSTSLASSLQQWLLLWEMICCAELLSAFTVLEAGLPEAKLCEPA